MSDFLPPILHRKLTQYRAARQPVFASYHAATAARGADYHDPDLAGVVLEKTRRMLARDPRLGVSEHQAVATLLAVTTAAAVAGRSGHPLRVLDFGGAFGTSYHLVRDALPGQYRWAVVETPTFVGFASEVDTPDLRMFATIDEAKAWLGEVDLLYSSSALQYVPDPLSMVDRLLDTRPACAAWLRSAFSATDPVVVLQRSRLRDNGPGPLPEGITDVEVHYPRTYVSLPDFMSRFQPEYRLVIAYGNGTPALELGGVMATEGSNYLFVRQDH